MWRALVFGVIVVVHSRTIKEDVYDWDSLIEKINLADTTWTANKNFHADVTPESLTRLLGAQLDDEYDGPIKTLDDFPYRSDIPEEFDSRTQWPYCKAIGHIRDQGYCGSCWAVAAASALTDRFCVASKGEHTAHLSMEDVLSCCNDCGHGCEGGSLLGAWRHFKKVGIVSGGDFDSHLGCQPYSMHPCEHHTNGSRPQCYYYGDLPTPSCSMRCINSRHHSTYKDDHHKVSHYYMLNETKAIQREIMEHGPVEAAFHVYEDFLTYKSGIYKHVTGKPAGGHAVKMIGWGVENGTPYWLIANSWNSDWGENGYFRILRGSSHCGIEDYVYGGIPMLSAHVD